MRPSTPASCRTISAPRDRIRRYSSIDDKIDPLHYYTTLIKFGIGSATYDAAQEIRTGKITREEGVALVRRYDTEFPARYFGETLEYMGISRRDVLEHHRQRTFPAPMEEGGRRMDAAPPGAVKPELTIAGRGIGPGHPPLVVAEIGINHEGDVGKAMRMIDDAASAGCECVKFQTHVVDDEMIPNNVVPGNASESIWDIMARCALSEEDERTLKRYAESRGLIFLSTPFSRAAADRLERLGVAAYKIGSGECNNYPLVEHIARFGRPVILSTGMNTLESVGKSVAILRRHGIPFALLHCTSIYPTPYQRGPPGRARRNSPHISPDAVIGLSDHSLSNYPCLGAVALGACILERHFTSNKGWPGPDIRISMDPADLRQLIEGSRAIHESLGGSKNVLPEEAPTIRFAYASVVAIRDIAAGEAFTRDNTWVKRPGTGEILAEEFPRGADAPRRPGHRQRRTNPMGLGSIVKRVVFLTGTRADFGKLKPLMRAVDGCPFLESAVFVTGMHMLSRYGLTIDEVIKAGFTRVHAFMNQFRGEPSEHILANTITGLSRYVQEYEPDMIVVHGDRIEALAGAIVGALRNVLVAHIEGGELSGTIDETIRHAVSKLAHLHFVANQDAAERLRQLGERPGSIYVIGSPDIDIMLSDDLPDLETVLSHYGIHAQSYGIVLFHPVTTEPYAQDRAVSELIAALIESGLNYVVIYPNNDPGSECILERYAALDGGSRFKLLPSMRFESFLTLLKHAQVIVGNSSAGIREAPVYGVPTVNIGSRQQNRFRYESILDVADDLAAIRDAIAQACQITSVRPSRFFGDGHSAPRFLRTLSDVAVWQTPRQKQFCDVETVPELALP